jgi:hypothetical protein
MTIEPGAVIVRGEMRKCVENDEVERVARSHTGREAELSCARRMRGSAFLSQYDRNPLQISGWQEL